MISKVHHVSLVVIQEAKLLVVGSTWLTKVYQALYLLSLNLAVTDVDVDSEACPKVKGKVLLYNSRAKDAAPAMMMMQEVGSLLPPILHKLAGRYSPVRSE